MTSPRVILFAENEPDDVLLTQQALIAAGADVRLVSVANGDEALRYLKGEGRYADRDAFPQPCLLLLDLKMPRLTGLGVLQWLHEHPDIQGNLPVVILSSWDEPADVQAATAMGAAAYRLKPNHFDELVALMREVKQRWLDPA